MPDAPGAKRILLFPYDRSASDRQIVQVSRFLLGCIPLPAKKIDRNRDEVEAEYKMKNWRARQYDYAIYFRDTLGDLGAVRAGVIYIVGHCEAGAETIASSAYPFLGNNVTVSPEEIVGMLWDAGLRDFSGTLKMFACESALSGSDSRAEAFAARLAQEALKRWPRCHVLGYNNTIKLYEKGAKAVGRTEFDRFGQMKVSPASSVRTA